MKSLRIIRDIVNHKNAYETLGIEAPPYRITCKEHKYLVNLLLKDEEVKGKLSQYYGVEIQVVMIVDDYL